MPLGEARSGVLPRDTTQIGQLILGHPGAPRNPLWFSGLLEVRDRCSDAEGPECRRGEKAHPAEPR